MTSFPARAADPRKFRNLQIESVMGPEKKLRVRWDAGHGTMMLAKFLKSGCDLSTFDKRNVNIREIDGARVKQGDEKLV